MVWFSLNHLITDAHTRLHVKDASFFLYVKPAADLYTAKSHVEQSTPAGLFFSFPFETEWFSKQEFLLFTSNYLLKAKFSI